MCEISETLPQPIESKTGYKVVRKRNGKYYGYISYYPFNGGKAPVIDPYQEFETYNHNFTMLEFEVDYSQVHRGKYSLFERFDDACSLIDLTLLNIVILECECKNITHFTTVYNHSDSFLAEEIISFKELKHEII